MNILKISCVLLLLTIFVSAEELSEKTKVWVDKRKAKLVSVEEPSKIKRSKLNESEKANKNGDFRSYPSSGYLKFPDGSWLLLSSHSSHQEDGVGDISIIRTSKGEYYYNVGHCCKPILLWSKKPIKSLKTFLESKGKSGKGKMTKWVKLP